MAAVAEDILIIMKNIGDFIFIKAYLYYGKYKKELPFERGLLVLFISRACYSSFIIVVIDRITNGFLFRYISKIWDIEIMGHSIIGYFMLLLLALFSYFDIKRYGKDEYINILIEKYGSKYEKIKGWVFVFLPFIFLVFAVIVTMIGKEVRTGQGKVLTDCFLCF
ncbi:MAG: hypothetical protein LBS50_03180 [Prevotellaceae bacterium]|nr:hypothetical protein [Prevotellaceae bacterium]